jgi:subtilisin family serine protease
MSRTARRSRFAVLLETLEPRYLLSLAASIPPEGPAAAPNPADTILVRFAQSAPDMKSASILGALGGRDVESFPQGPTVITLPPGVDRNSVISQLRADPNVVYAEPDGVLHVADTVPNDPLFSAQWGLSNPDGVDIEATKAWDITRGSASTVIAVVDSGIDLTHPDLVSRLWTNPVDGTHGWNFINNTANVQDDNGHGTNVSGILGAATNDGVGGAGVNWAARIMPLKFIGADGNGSTDAAVSAIYWAVQHGARVINASWDGSEYSQALYDSINYAGTQGVVVVVAAGNESANNDIVATYPASIRLPNVISVAAIDSSGNLASFSNYGASTVDLAAPGVNIWSTVPGSYAAWSGTSMAAPFVTGVVSLVIGQNPSLTAAQVVHQVLANTKPLPGLQGTTVTGGMVDAFRALGGNSVTANYSQGLTPGNLSVAGYTTTIWSSRNLVTGAVSAVPFGSPGLDIAVPGNYNGPGPLEYAVYRPSTAQWIVEGPGGPYVVQFGEPGVDVPVPADYDGTGRTDFAVFRPTTATWYIWSVTRGPYSVQLGEPNWDQPVPADYDGDGKADLAVFRPNTAQWFILQSRFGPTMRQLGDPGTVPVPADFDAVGHAELAVYEPSLGLWKVQHSSGLVQTVLLGPVGFAIPVAADFNHDGTADLGVYQVNTGDWYILLTNGGYVTELFGWAGLDRPIESPLFYRLLGTILDPTIRAASHAAAFVPAGSGSGSLKSAALDLVSLPQPAASTAPPPADPAHRSRSAANSSRWLHDAALEGVTSALETLEARTGLTG